MNNIQKTIVILALVCIIGMWLFPPWYGFSQVGWPPYHIHPITFAAGYHGFWWVTNDNVRIDSSQLLVQCFVVTVLGGGVLLLSFGKRKP